MNTQETTRRDVIAALDIGSSKTTCFIAQNDPNEGLRILGVGTHQSSGLRNGVIVDMEATEKAISGAMDTAEQMAGFQVNKVILGISGAHITSHRLSGDVSVAGHAIQDADVHQVLDTAAATIRHAEDAADSHSIPIHQIPVRFCIDGGADVKNPVGMHGETLLVAVLMANAAQGPIRNLESVTKRSHIDIESFVIAPYASGLSCLTSEERELGVTVIDMGAGTTSVAVFQGGHVIHMGVLPIGGQHVTNDIARGLSTPVASAERLKTLYGHALHAASAEREMLDVPMIGEDEDCQTNQVARSMLTQIIRPRLEETFEMVRDHLETAGVYTLAGRRVVLTGGASQLNGTAEVAAEILQRQITSARPLDLKGMADAVAGPGFATCAGLLRYGVTRQSFNRGLDRLRKPFTANDTSTQRVPSATSRLGRLGQWFRQNF